MTRRLQILIDQRRFELLQGESERTGAAIAELIRDAIDRTYTGDVAARVAAAEAFLTAEPVAVEDWEVLKREVRDTLYPAELR